MSIYQIDQASECDVTEVTEGPFSLRYAYARSKDSQINNENGQDYITWRDNSEKLVFALCDGVSKSFFCEIGAKLLGNMLVSWLWECEFDENYSPDYEPQQLKDYLNSQVPYARKIIEHVDLRHINNEYIRNALNNRRLQTGTQSNFVCGVIELPGKKFPNGKLDLFWLGDAKLKIFKGMNDFSYQLSTSWSSEEGWSSKDGVIGEIHHYQATYRDIDAIIAHSDGLDKIRGILTPNLHSAALEKRIQEQLETPESDDISFLEITVGIPIPVPPKIRSKKPAKALLIAMLVILLFSPFGYLVWRSTRRPPPIEIIETSTTDTITVEKTQEAIESQIIASPQTTTPVVSKPQNEELITQSARLLTGESSILLSKGCNNISNFSQIDISTAHLKIDDQFYVKAYTNNACSGDPLMVRFERQTVEVLSDDIQSLYVDEVLFR